MMIDPCVKNSSYLNNVKEFKSIGNREESKGLLKWDSLHTRVWKWNIHCQIQGCLHLLQHIGTHPNNMRIGTSQSKRKEETFATLSKALEGVEIEGHKSIVDQKKKEASMLP